MKKLLVVILLMFIASVALADKLIIPFSCYPKEVQARLATKGFKVDLDPNDRDVNSWGFIVNEGTRYTLVTYMPVSIEELQIIQALLMGENK
jgi:hypothetical protein